MKPERAFMLTVGPISFVGLVAMVVGAILSSRISMTMALFCFGIAAAPYSLLCLVILFLILHRMIARNRWE